MNGPCETGRVLREVVEEALGEHSADLDETAVWQGACACGWRMSDPTPFPDEGIHRQHVAEAVLALLSGRLQMTVLPCGCQPCVLH